MKRVLAILLALCLLAALTACGTASAPSNPQVVATIFPLYDWTSSILGDSDAVSLRLLLDSGTDMHSFQPSVEDVAAISTCSLLIYVGGESDAWVTDALKNAVNKDMIVLNLMEVLGDAAKAEETVEGMQSDEDGEGAYDEHIWLSLNNARLCCEAIEKALLRLDGPNGALYARNLAAYLEQLAVLDREYAAAAAAGAADTLLFADRFPFRYLLDDYDIAYYAAFPGCEAETEASFETIRFLAGKLDALRLPAVMVTESPAPRLAETVIENSALPDTKILTMDSMQSVTAKQIADGADYLDIMTQNLSSFREALG